MQAREIRDEPLTGQPGRVREQPQLPHVRAVVRTARRPAIQGRRVDAQELRRPPTADLRVREHRAKPAGDLGLIQDAQVTLCVQQIPPILQVIPENLTSYWQVWEDLVMAKAPTPLRLAIATSGITQREIAAVSGIEATRLSRIVNGLHCDEATRETIADVLGREKTELWPIDDEAEAA